MKTKAERRTKKRRYERKTKRKTKRKPSSHNRSLSKPKSLIKGLRATLKNYKRIKTEHNIKDVPFSKKVSKGTAASCNNVDYHYQNYTNVMDFLKNINHPSTCFFKEGEAFLSLDISNMKKGLNPLSNIKLFTNNLKSCILSKNRFIPVILNLITDEGSHANIMLIDKVNKIIELYEPHGARVSSSVLGGVIGAYKKKIAAIRKFWKRILPRFNVVNVVDYNRGTAFQMARDPSQHSGFCVTWTILFVHYRLINPHVPLSILIRYISKRVTTLKLLQYARYVEDNIKLKNLI